MDQRRLRIKQAIFDELVGAGLLGTHEQNRRPCRKCGFVGCIDPRCHIKHSADLSNTHGLIAVGYPILGGAFRLSKHAPVDRDFWERVRRMTSTDTVITEVDACQLDHDQRRRCIVAIAAGVLIFGIDILNLDVHGPKCTWATMHNVGLHQQLWYNHDARQQIDRLARERDWIGEAKLFGRSLCVDDLTVYETLHWHYDCDTGHDCEEHTTWRIEPEHELFQRYTVEHISTMTEEEFLAVLDPNHAALELTV